MSTALRKQTPMHPYPCTSNCCVPVAIVTLSFLLKKAYLVSDGVIRYVQPFIAITPAFAATLVCLTYRY